MALLESKQKKIALELLHECLNSPKDKDGLCAFDKYIQGDKNRVNIIENELKPLLQGYLKVEIDLPDFKSKIDGINKRHRLWGFKGIKGQMFFNMVVNTADDLDECDQELKSAITVPQNEQIASSRIKTFAGYIKRLGDQWAGAGNDRRGAPKISSVLFFLSYFWQIQNRNTWPIYYTNSVQIMLDMNLWHPSEELAKDYLEFKEIHEELIELYSKETQMDFNLYMVEHVFWYRGGSPYQPASSEETTTPKTSSKDTDFDLVDGQKLPESYIPPIISVLHKMAKNDPKLKEAASISGTTLERAFEKNIHAAFTILGYDTKPLGQGKGRVPDGIARAIDEDYIIIWDAKVRAEGYSMGTDDRTIREYIGTQSRAQKKIGRVRNIYYMIISSEFNGDFDDLIRSLKMDTDVNEVILVEAEALVALVEAKLRDPLEISLGSDGIQRLLTTSDILTAETVREQLI